MSLQDPSLTKSNIAKNVTTTYILVSSLSKIVENFSGQEEGELDVLERKGFIELEADQNTFIEKMQLNIKYGDTNNRFNVNISLNISLLFLSMITSVFLAYFNI